MLGLYPVTATLPASERFGLVSQLRRAAVSVPSNVAAGSKRQGRNDFAHFLNLNIAEGSSAETEYLLTLAVDLGYVPQATAAPLLADISTPAGGVGVGTLAGGVGVGTLAGGVGVGTLAGGVGLSRRWHVGTRRHEVVWLVPLRLWEHRPRLATASGMGSFAPLIIRSSKKTCHAYHALSSKDAAADGCDHDGDSDHERHGDSTIATGVRRSCQPSGRGVQPSCEVRAGRTRPAVPLTQVVQADRGPPRRARPECRDLLGRGRFRCSVAVRGRSGTDRLQFVPDCWSIAAELR